VKKKKKPAARDFVGRQIGPHLQKTRCFFPPIGKTRSLKDILSDTLLNESYQTGSLQTTRFEIHQGQFINVAQIICGKMV